MPNGEWTNFSDEIKSIDTDLNSGVSKKASDITFNSYPRQASTVYVSNGNIREQLAKSRKRVSAYGEDLTDEEIIVRRKKEASLRLQRRLERLKKEQRNERIRDLEDVASLVVRWANGKSEKIRNFVMSKTTPILLSTSLIFGGISIAGVVGVTKAQYDSFERATATSQTIDLPNQIYGDEDLVILNNGQAYFENSQGERLAGYNGQMANDLASPYINQVTAESLNGETDLDGMDIGNEGRSPSK